MIAKHIMEPRSPTTPAGLVASPPGYGYDHHPSFSSSPPSSSTAFSSPPYPAAAADVLFELEDVLVQEIDVASGVPLLPRPQPSPLIIAACGPAGPSPTSPTLLGGGDESFAASPPPSAAALLFVGGHRIVLSERESTVVQMSKYVFDFVFYTRKPQRRRFGGGSLSKRGMGEAVAGIGSCLSSIGSGGGGAGSRRGSPTRAAATSPSLAASSSSPVATTTSADFGSDDYHGEPVRAQCVRVCLPLAIGADDLDALPHILACYVGAVRLANPTLSRASLERESLLVGGGGVCGHHHAMMLGPSSWVSQQRSAHASPLNPHAGAGAIANIPSSVGAAADGAAGTSASAGGGAAASSSGAAATLSAASSLNTYGWPFSGVVGALASSYASALGMGGAASPASPPPASSPPQAPPPAAVALVSAALIGSPSVTSSSALIAAAPSPYHNDAPPLSTSIATNVNYYGRLTAKAINAGTNAAVSSIGRTTDAVVAATAPCGDRPVAVPAIVKSSIDGGRYVAQTAADFTGGIASTLVLAANYVGSYAGDAIAGAIAGDGNGNGGEGFLSSSAVARAVIPPVAEVGGAVISTGAVVFNSICDAQQHVLEATKSNVARVVTHKLGPEVGDAARGVMETARLGAEVAFVGSSKQVKRAALLMAAKTARQAAETAVDGHKRIEQSRLTDALRPGMGGGAAALRSIAAPPTDADVDGGGVAGVRSAPAVLLRGGEREKEREREREALHSESASPTASARNSPRGGGGEGSLRTASGSWEMVAAESAEQGPSAVAPSINSPPPPRHVASPEEITREVEGPAAGESEEANAAAPQQVANESDAEVRMPDGVGGNEGQQTLFGAVSPTQRRSPLPEQMSRL